jgi:hypothetical protein
MLPQLKLALLFATFAKNHGSKVMHANNVDLLTADLGNALQKQKDILADRDKGVIMTAYDVLPVILEVKLLTTVVAKKLDIETKDKSSIAILEEIIQKSEERGEGERAEKIKSTLEWTRDLFEQPEIKKVLEMDMTEIEKPDSIKGVGRFFKQVGGRGMDEFNRVQEFLKRTKDASKEDKSPPASKKSPAKKKPGKKPGGKKPGSSAAAA